MTLRQLSLCKLLIDNNYDVEIIGIGTTSKYDIKQIANVKCTLIPQYKNFFIHQLLHPIKFTKFVINLIGNNGNFPDLIHVTGIPLFTFQRLKKYAKKNHIRYSHDSVEWYSHEEFIGLWYFDVRMFLGWLNENIRIYFLIDRSMYIVAISTYLRNYFHKKNISAYILPIVGNVRENMPVKITADKILHITYAGSPGRKDCLKEIVLSINKLLPTERELIDVTVFGVDSIQLTKLCNSRPEYVESLSCIHPLGMVSRERVLSRLNETDFTILIRSSTARYAKAGFPTKVVESLMSSTPVICNMTSDLGMYLKDGYDCIEVEHEDPESIVKALRRALALTPEQKDQMKKNARKTAEEKFDYRLYIEEFGKFIKNEY